ncbi:MAG: EF-hand domain-containing protein [Candidatus Binatia bacterium]
MKTSTVISALALILTVILRDHDAFAQPGPQRAMKCEERFTALDTDRDGRVTREEFMKGKHPGGHAEEVFQSRDSNKDGMLTKEEFCAGKGKTQGKGSKS